MITAAGRSLVFNYDAELGSPTWGLPLTLATSDTCTVSRVWNLHYDPDTLRLIHVEDAMKTASRQGYMNSFTYYPAAHAASGHLRTISDKYDPNTDGTTPEVYTFNYTDGRLTSVNDPTGDGGGRTQSMTYACAESEPRAATSSSTYTDRRGARGRIVS